MTIRDPRPRALLAIAGLSSLFVVATAVASATAAAPLSAQETPEWWEALADLPGGVHVVPVDSVWTFVAETEAEVGEALRSFGVRTEPGFRGAAHGSRRILDYRWEELASGDCRMGDVQVLLRSVILMPRFENVERVAPELQRKWEVYRQAIRNHELEHRRIMEANYNQLRDSLVARPSAPCREARNALPQIVVDMRDAFRARQLAFDSADYRDNPISWPPRDPSAVPLWWEAYDNLPGGVHILPVDSGYTFEADHPRGIRLNMDAYGPTQDGERFDAQHSATWRWSYEWERTDAGECVIGDLRIIARSVINMPRLANADALGPEVRAQWEQYHTALRIHELGHRNILERFLLELRERMLAEPARPCDAWQDRLDTIYDAEMPRLSELQDDYDDRTDHGRTEGAVWPPSGR